MANGDAAIAAGMVTVASTAQVRLGYDEMNKTRDYVANYAKRAGPLIDIYVGPTAPAHAVGRIWIKTS